MHKFPVNGGFNALVEADFFAAQVYGLRNNHSSDDVSFSGFGVVVVIHMAYPPSALNTTAAETMTVTNPVITLPTTVTIPGGTNNVISQLIKK